MIIQADVQLIRNKLDSTSSEIQSAKMSGMSLGFNFIHWIFVNLEACITKLTFYHIRSFLLSKDAFTSDLAEFGSVS